MILSFKRTDFFTSPRGEMCITSHNPLWRGVVYRRKMSAASVWSMKDRDRNQVILIKKEWYYQNIISELTRSLFGLFHSSTTNSSVIRLQTTHRSVQSVLVCKNTNRILVKLVLLMILLVFVVTYILTFCI